MKATHRRQPSTFNVKNLQTRFLSATVLVILLIGYLSLGILANEAPVWNLDVDSLALNYAFVAFSGLICFVLSWELLRVFKIREWWELLILLSLVLLMFIFPIMKANFDFPIYRHWNITIWFSWWQDFIVLIVYFLIFGIVGRQAPSVKSFGRGLMLAVICLMIILAMKAVDNITLSTIGNQSKYGFITLIWIWSTIILTDIFSYLGGSLLGKHKLAPHVSPNKTWEGTIIGCGIALIGGLLVSLLSFYLVANHQYGPFAITLINLGNNQGFSLPGVFLGVMTLFITVATQLGDLFFSSVKRRAKVKDYSRLIPGHGGLLDRLDSFIFVFFLFFFITLFI